MRSLPRTVQLLAGIAMVVGGLGGGRALSEVVAYSGDHDDFVVARRRELEVRSQITGRLPAEVLDKVGDQVGERAWSRRGINLPLAIANLVLSTMLFVGAMRALGRSHWGHGAWQFAAMLSVPYTVLQTVVLIIEAHDGRDANVALIAAMQKHGPVEALATLQTTLERVIVGAGAALLVAYYAFCAVYLRRPAVTALFVEPTAE